MKLSALRFCGVNFLLLLNIGLLLNGGAALWGGFAAVMFINTVVDEWVGDIADDDAGAPPAFLDAMARLSLPLVVVNSLLFAFYFSAAETTWLGAALAQAGVDFDGARATTTALDLVGAIVSLGALYGLCMNIAHELTHRIADPVTSTMGRWLSAFNCESSFSLQHSTNHHINGGIFEDPGTSRRSESIYAFVVRAAIGNNRAAWRNERERLQRRGLPLWSHHNRFLTGQAMSLTIAFAYYLVGGFAAVGAYLLVGMQGRFYLEAAAYVQHYGLVRVPGTRFEPRHAWNSYRVISNGMLFNLPIHVHHHLYANKPFYELRRDPGAPLLPYGYVTMFALAMIPPLFDHVMHPLIAEWDLRQATDAERRYLIENGKELWLPAPAE